jgi:hypothetical protein
MEAQAEWVDTLASAGTPEAEAAPALHSMETQPQY